jgi:hypothetical protein
MLWAGAKKMKPDVIVKTGHETMLFQPQNRLASEWLHRRCGLVTDDITGDTELRVHPRKCQSIIAELNAAGFIVSGVKDELC